MTRCSDQSGPLRHRLLMSAAILLGGSGAIIPTTVLAQAKAPDSAATGSGDIIVTARRRQEKAQDVPASLVVFKGSELDNTAITRLDELQFRTPGLKITGGGVATVAIRGVSNNASALGGSPSVAVSVDGVYAPRPAFVLLENYDLDRIEVLKGPQGTLYGRNATGGAINIVTRDPGTNFGADGYVGYGSFNLVRAETAVDLPFENGGIRISGDLARDDGYTKNVNPAGGRIDRQDFKSIRGKGIYHFSPNVKGTLTVQYVDDDGNLGSQGSNVPGDDSLYASLGEQRIGPRVINVNDPPVSNQKALLVSGVLEADLGGIMLKSITGYLHNTTYLRQDDDGTSAFIEYAIGKTRSNYISQEFDVAGGSQRTFSWTGGLYVSQERTQTYTLLEDADFPIYDPYDYYDESTHDRARTVAVFGEGTLALGSHASLIVGGRYTAEDIRGYGSGTVLGSPFSGGGEESDHGFTPRVLVQYKPSADTMLYASVTRGLKGGGINYSSPILAYKPEKIWAYEVGAKNSFMDGRAHLNLAAFYYDYTDLQLRTAVFPAGEGVQIRVSNVAKSDIYGAEASFDLHPMGGLTLSGNAQYLHTRLKDFISPSTLENLSGLPLPISPEWTATIAADYRFDLHDRGALTVHGEYNYTSSIIFPALADPSLERQGKVGLVNATLRYDLPGNRIYVSVIGRNLTDKLYLTNRFYFAGFSDLETFAAPRTVEGRIGFKF